MKPLNEMTAEELVNTALVDNYDLYNLVVALHNKLKEAITPNPDEIHIVWSVEDVYTAANNIKEPAEVTLEQAREVLNRVEDEHDASIGISWDSIVEHLQDVLEGR